MVIRQIYNNKFKITKIISNKKTDRKVIPFLTTLIGRAVKYGYTYTLSFSDVDLKIQTEEDFLKAIKTLRFHKNNLDNEEN